MSELINNDTFFLDCVVTNKSEPQGTGSFWDFVLKADDGKEYKFDCNSESQLHFRANNFDIPISFEGYKQLKNVYTNVRVYIPNSNREYVINNCVNKDCNGICPSVIVMSRAGTKSASVSAGSSLSQSTLPSAVELGIPSPRAAPSVPSTTPKMASNA